MMSPQDDMNMGDNPNMDMSNDDEMAEIPMDNPNMMDNNDENIPMDGGDMGEGDSSEIQSMSGKLANLLRNTENVNDKKFAAGMINAAAIEGLSSADRKAILKKVKENESDVPDEGMGDEDMPMTETFIFTKQQVNEIRKRNRK